MDCVYVLYMDFISVNTKSKSDFLILLFPYRELNPGLPGESRVS